MEWQSSRKLCYRGLNNPQLILWFPFQPMAFTEDEMRNGIPNMYVGWIFLFYSCFSKLSNFEVYQVIQMLPELENCQRSC